MKKIKWVLIYTVTLAVSACEKDSVDNPKPDNMDSVDNSELEVNIDKVLILKIANEYRSKNIMCDDSLKESAPALKWDDELARTALNHSNDMQKNNYYNHTGQNGSKFYERASDAGYTGAPLGENIAKGNASEELIMKLWMESKWHCINIMNAKATEIGIAKSDEESEGGSLWTMVLGKE